MYVLRGAAGYNPVMALLTDWRDHRDRQMLPGAGRRVDEARKDGENLGYDRGIADALAVFANQMRVQMYDKWEMIPILTGHDILRVVMMPSIKLLKELMEQVDNEDLKDKKEQRDRRNEALSSWLFKTSEMLDKAALPEDMMQREIERHRQAVLDGQEEPTEEDREWILETLGKVKQQWSSIERLLPKGVKPE